jgi:hypothetical protein
MNSEHRKTGIHALCISSRRARAKPDVAVNSYAGALSSVQLSARQRLAGGRGARRDSLMAVGPTVIGDLARSRHNANNVPHWGASVTPPCSDSVWAEQCCILGQACYDSPTESWANVRIAGTRKIGCRIGREWKAHEGAEAAASHLR